MKRLVCSGCVDLFLLSFVPNIVALRTIVNNTSEPHSPTGLGKRDTDLRECPNEYRTFITAAQSVNVLAEILAVSDFIIISGYTKQVDTYKAIESELSAKSKVTKTPSLSSMVFLG